MQRWSELGVVVLIPLPTHSLAQPLVTFFLGLLNDFQSHLQFLVTLGSRDLLSP